MRQRARTGKGQAQLGGVVKAEKRAKHHRHQSVGKAHIIDKPEIRAVGKDTAIKKRAHKIDQGGGQCNKAKALKSAGKAVLSAKQRKGDSRKEGGQTAKDKKAQAVSRTGIKSAAHKAPKERNCKEQKCSDRKRKSYRGRAFSFKHRKKNKSADERKQRAPRQIDQGVRRIFPVSKAKVKKDKLIKITKDKAKREKKPTAEYVRRAGKTGAERIFCQHEDHRASLMVAADTRPSRLPNP